MPNKKNAFFLDSNFFSKIPSNTHNKPKVIIVDTSNKIVKSSRIDLKPLEYSDIEEYYKLYSDPIVMEKYCEGTPRNKEQVDKLMGYYLKQKEPSYFSIFEKESSNFIGTIFLTSRNQDSGKMLLGYLINKEYWGNNYVKESLYSLLFCLFPLTNKDISLITATTRDDNPASMSILEKFGFKCIETVEKFGQKRLTYELDTKKVSEFHKNIEIFDIDPLKKNLGIFFLTSSDLIENSHLYKYLLEEIISPLLPDETSSQIEQLLSYAPQENSYWITTHFVFTSLGYFSLSNHDPRYSFFSKFSLPLFSTFGYSSKLFISDLHRNMAQERLKSNFNNNLEFTSDSFLDNCFYEVALTTTSGFIFSLPTALAFTPFGLSYSAFSTISSFTSSTVSCASSNKLFVSPNDKSFSAKLIPYLVDSVVAFSTFYSFSFHSIHSLTEVALNIKKTALVVSSVVSVDHITKSIIELSPDEPFKYLDSFFGFVSNIDSNNPEL